jgi:hypothetical protein
MRKIFEEIGGKTVLPNAMMPVSIACSELDEWTKCGNTAIYDVNFVDINCISLNRFFNCTRLCFIPYCATARFTIFYKRLAVANFKGNNYNSIY